MSWGSVVGATGYTLEEAPTSSFSGATTVYSGTATSHAVVGQASGTYVYRVRATDARGGGAWSNTQSVTVLPPAAPPLDAIANADGDGSYSVSWGSVAGATGYTLEEAPTSSFSGATTVYSGTATSHAVVGQASGTYVYRVKATDARGDSAWSAPQSVLVWHRVFLPLSLRE